MTEPFDKDHTITELIINGRDDPSRMGFWPDIYCNLAKLNRIVISNPMMTVKRDTVLYFCVKIVLDPKKYAQSFVNLGNTALPNYRPVATQFKDFAAQKTDFDWLKNESISLYFPINIVKGDYDITQLMEHIKATINSNHEKTIGVKSSFGDVVKIIDKPFNNGNDLLYQSRFRIHFDYSLVNGKIRWLFRLWEQMDSGIVATQPQALANDSLTYTVECPTKGVNIYINSNLANHTCYFSGEKWFIDKLGLDESKDCLPINYGNATAHLYIGESNNPIHQTTSITGFNDVTGYGNRNYVKNELLQVDSPFIYDLRIGNGVYLCLKNFGTAKNMMYDTQGVSHNAVHYIPFRTRKFGSIIDEFPMKWLNIGTNVLSNNFEVYFVDEEGVKMDNKDLNFILSILLYSRNSQLKFQ